MAKEESVNLLCRDRTFREVDKTSKEAICASEEAGRGGGKRKRGREGGFPPPSPPKGNRKV